MPTALSCINCIQAGIRLIGLLNKWQLITCVWWALFISTIVQRIWPQRSSAGLPDRSAPGFRLRGLAGVKDFNALETGDVYQMPVMFISGSCDWICPVRLIEDYMDVIVAPKKNYT